MRELAQPIDNQDFPTLHPSSAHSRVSLLCFTIFSNLTAIRNSRCAKIETFTHFVRRSPGHSMKHWIYFTIALVAALAAFLRVWSTAPEYENRQRLRAELELIATDYNACRREIGNILRNPHSTGERVEQYLDSRPEVLVRRAEADVALRAVAAQFLWGRGWLDEAQELFERVAGSTPRLNVTNVQRLPLVRRVGVARALAEVGRVEEARIAAESSQRALDGVILAGADLGAIFDLGWVWRRLGEEERAKANWERMVVYHADQPARPYFMACYNALAGHPEAALDYLDAAVTNYRIEANRDPIDLEFFIDRDPDLASIRELPRFKEIRSELTRRVEARDAYWESVSRQSEEPEPAGSEEPEPVP